MSSQYDLAVLGAGPAGLAAAMRGHDLGMRTLLIGAGVVGGGGLWGALSSKTLWHLSNDAVRARLRGRGYRAASFELDEAEIRAEVEAAVWERTRILGSQLHALSTDNGPFRYVAGRGYLEGSNRIAVTPDALEGAASSPKLVFDAKHIVLCTGSTPRVPPGITIDGTHVMTSDHIDRRASLPKSLLIVGAGVVGCEYATIFGNFGATDVRVLDRQPRILPAEDADVAEVVRQNMERLGIVVHHACKLESLELVAPGTKEAVRYRISDANGNVTTHHVECALIATGRKPALSGLGLENADLTLTDAGQLEAKDGQTSRAHIYAAGDATADVALVNIAELEGRHAVESIAGLTPKAIRYEALPAIMFLKPELAAVGLNERMAKEQGIAYRAGVISNRFVARNVAMRATEGFIKLLAQREAPHRILGLRVVGPQAASTAQGVAYLIDRGATLEEIDHCLHAHPAVPEGVQECARLLLGCSLHKPQVFGSEWMRIVEG
jgi:dihydrolipoamide dehydrogenase